MKAGRSKALASLWLAMLLPAAAAHAAPPTLQPLTVHVSPDERSVTATWSLPPNMHGYLVEAANAPDVHTTGDLKGQFLAENLVGSALIFVQNATSMKFSPDPGHVWVHVAAYDGTSPACLSPYNADCIKEFSEAQDAELPQGSPPGLVSVGEMSRRLTAEWWRSPWHRNWFIEAASSPAVYGSGELAGYFVAENVTFFDSYLTDDQTTYLSREPLPVGTHYVHLATYDASGCCDITFSNTREVTIAATPPVLQSATQEGGILRAGWSLPAGMQTRFIEVATSPAVYPSGPLAGFFLDEHLVLYDDFLTETQTSYVADTPLPDGVYFVHVAATPVGACPTPDALTCVDEFSAVRRVVVGSQPAPPAAPAVAADTGTAFASLSVPKRLSARNLVVRAAMGEAGTITANGTVNVPGSSRVYRLAAVSAKAGPGNPVRLKLTLPRAVLKKVRTALRRHRRVVANLTLTARDLSGNAAVEKRKVRLRR